METVFATLRATLENAENAANSCALQGDDTAHKLRVLADDFEFNLSLLQERDEELEKCDEAMRVLRREASDKDALLSDLHMRLADKSADFDNLKAFHHNQDMHHTDQMRKIRRDHEAAIQEYIQTASLKQQEMNDLQTTCDLKIKSYTDEIASLRDVEKRWKETQWELMDYKKQTSTELALLKHELHKTSQQLESQSAYHDSQTSFERTEFESKEKTLKTHILTLQHEIETLSETNLNLEYSLKSHLESHKRAVKELNSTIETRELEATKLTLKVEKVGQKMKKVTQSQEGKIRKLCEKMILEQKQFEHALSEMESAFLKEYDSLKHLLSARDDRIQQLEAHVDTLERDVLILGDEVSKRMSTEKSTTEKRTEDLILKKLKESERGIQSVLREKELVVEDMEKLRTEFNRLLEDHTDLTTRSQTRETTLTETYHTQLSSLETQNAQLCNVIKQMRADMEQLQNQVPFEQPPPHHQMNEYTQFVAHDAAVANQQVQQLVEIVQQKQMLIDQLLKTNQSSGGVVPPDPIDAERLTRLGSENETLQQRVRDLTGKVVEACGDKMRLLDVCNGLRAELRQGKGQGKVVGRDVASQTIAMISPLESNARKSDVAVGGPDRKQGPTTMSTIATKKAKSAPSLDKPALQVSEKEAQME
ncbi:hypothetical protein HDU98_007586, partial [Podochytrium sp. JEL0797]